MSALRNIFSPFTYIKLVVNLKMKLAGLKLLTVKSEHLKIEFWDSESDKPVLVLIQAFAAESKYSWHKQVLALKKDYRLIIPNLLYFGGSEMKGSKSYSLNDQVRALHLVLNSQNIEKVILCGASIGGVIATEFSDQFPHMVQKLVLMNSPLKYDDHKDIQTILDRFELASKEDLLVPKTPADLHRLFGVSYYKKPPIPKFVFKDIHKELYANSDDKRKLVVQSSQEMNQLTTKEYQLKIPILLIWGQKDHLCPVRIGNELKAYFGDLAELVVIPHTAHMPNFEKPRTFNKILKSFLKS